MQLLRETDKQYHYALYYNEAKACFDSPLSAMTAAFKTMIRHFAQRQDQPVRVTICRERKI